MRRALLPTLLLLAAAVPAAAQTTGSQLRGPIMPEQRPSSGPRTPPPALPGLAGRRAPEPIPAETPGGSLAPNAALFDAINRGDMAAAREAMGRGADLNARNALGLTPVDAAVDQGRNEIAFYLLSARGSAGSGPTVAPREPAARPGRQARGRRGAPAEAEQAGSDDGPAPPSPMADDVPRSLPRNLSDPPRGGVPSSPSTPLAAGATRARLFAGDGGTPRPEIGFLGFDAGRPAGAVAPAEARAATRARPRRGW
ncbi:hypothetical protein [Muricoccus radiodurans]|uniref:hypothetical protein n=1 Tax=Muricoccus radiodurans TaxID=2231721 RepID=UPI003CFB2E51